MDGELISILRKDKTLAVITPTEDFKLGITVFHPLDAKAIRYLTGMAIHPHPEYGVCMRENNWEYALDCSAPTMGSALADDRGESYLAYWEYGLGVRHDKSFNSDYKKYLTQEPLMPNLVAAQIGLFYERSEDYA